MVSSVVYDAQNTGVVETSLDHSDCPDSFFCCGCPDCAIAMVAITHSCHTMVVLVILLAATITIPTNIQLTNIA